MMLLLNERSVQHKNQNKNLQAIKNIRISSPMNSNSKKEGAPEII